MDAPITIGYWSIRGLGAPLRMMASYSGKPYKNEMYDCFKKDGTWDVSSWFDAKPALKAKNPLMNLPYVMDSEGGSEFYVAQSNACFLYLARKFDMAGKTKEEVSACEQLLCEIMDIRNKVVGVVYTPGSGNAEAASKLFSSVEGMLEKISLWLQSKGGGPICLLNLLSPREE